MAKMLWEVKAPLAVARAREDMSLENIYKYLRYYKMFISRFTWKVEDKDYSERIENLLFWRGVVALVKDPVYGLIVCEVTNEKRDPNGFLTTIDVEAENGYKKKGLKVGENVVVLYSDNTHIAPVLYIWAIANEIIKREDIINQQDNMLRKPIIVSGEGEDFDNATNNVANILSGVAWFNYNPKKKKDIMSDRPTEVLNLQVGNAYKAPDLWDSRKHFEELICDYLGYTTVKNEKKERMNTSEVNKDNSIGMTFYKTSQGLRKKGSEDVKKVLGLELELVENLKQEGGEENGSKETNVGRTNEGD